VYGELSMVVIRIGSLARVRRKECIVLERLIQILMDVYLGRKRRHRFFQYTILLSTTLCCTFAVSNIQMEVEGHEVFGITSIVN